jgi:DNA-binding GntR family transcriptional regulator
MKADILDQDFIDEESESIERVVLSETVKERILQWIREGDLLPGSRIIETRIARRLGVSQAPVREALRTLETLGVVESRPHQGTRVRRASKKELIDAIQVRRELEVLAGRIAAARMDIGCIEQLDKYIAQMIAAASRGDALELSRKNVAFHAAIIDAADNVPLKRAWQQLDPLLRTYMTITLPGVDLNWIAQRHIKIFNALQERNPELAEQVIREHLEEVEAQTTQAVDHNGEVNVPLDLG